jgi:hypothetical protein
MFNNVKYKVNEHLHESVIMKSSDLRSSSKEWSEGGGTDSHSIPTDNTKVFTDYIISYKSQSLIKRILAIPHLITTIIKFINKI